jgi:Ser/Thr protein kinase RdoA (MazF antagonist)
MERLDFSQNFHEQLLRREVTDVQLYALGYYTAQLVANSPVSAPADVNWYQLATKRIGFLEQFISWLPLEYKIAMNESDCVVALKKHLEAHRTEYQAMAGDSLVVTIDNHDENIFFREGKPVFIDVVPPMQSWWYGVPWINLANIVVNVETLLSEDSAKIVEAGFKDYHGLKCLPAKEYAFTRALAYAISAAHFGSIEGKEVVAELYIERCKKIKEWL